MNCFCMDCLKERLKTFLDHNSKIVCICEECDNADAKYFVPHVSKIYVKNAIQRFIIKAKELHMNENQ